MDIMEMLSMVEPVPSTGWNENHVLPEECIFDLHGCLGLEYDSNENDRTGGSSPSTDVSTDNVNSWLDEMQDFPSNPNSVEGIYDILDSSVVETVFDDMPYLDLLELDTNLNYTELTVKSEMVYDEPRVTPEIFPSNRRKQRIVPRIALPVGQSSLSEVFTEEPNIKTVHVSCVTAAPYDHSNEMVHVSGNIDELKNNSICDDEKSPYIMSDNCVSKLLSTSWEMKTDHVSKPKRKRGLSNVEKRDRKRESNRNASYRYRQKKKEMLQNFKSCSDVISNDYNGAKNDYFAACEELLRYIKHANLIYAVKDGGKLLL